MIFEFLSSNKSLLRLSVSAEREEGNAGVLPLDYIAAFHGGLTETDSQTPHLRVF